MARNKPFVTIAIPTRNRPELIGYCMESLAKQSFTDFEVIISDNHTGKPCKHIFERFADSRFRYVTPPSSLSMYDNWEFACSFASGEYLTVLIDKTVLRPSALQIMYEVLQQNQVEVISWWNESYNLVDEDSGYGKGWYRPSFQSVSPYYFDPKREIERRFRLDVRRGREGIKYYLGKICFGAYHRSLMQRITKNLGRLFHPIAPDYTSMLAALTYAESAIDIGEPLLISINSKLSTGQNQSLYPEVALKFIVEIDPSLSILEAFPIRGLYTSQHNTVAHDYATMQQRIGTPLQHVTLNMPNLYIRAKEDLERVIWSDEAERIAQYKILQSYFNKMTLQEKLLIRKHFGLVPLQNVRRSLESSVARLIGNRELKIALKKMLKRPPSVDVQQRSYETVIQAARDADKHYQELRIRS